MQIKDSTLSDRPMPKFPPRPIDDARTPSLILSALPAELPAALRPEPPAPPPPSRKPGLPMKLAGLAAVLALLGFGVWALVSDDDAPPPAPQQVAESAFTRAAQPPAAVLDSDCANHAYGATKRFLAGTTCQQLTRALFTSRTDDGRTVYSSVAVVRMQSTPDARRLFDLVRQDNTGSVMDLVREHALVVPGLDRLSRGGFAAGINGADVVIVESDTARPGPDPVAHRAQMKRISTDALGLGHDLK
ncbi:hypothetical protein [Alloactinosynnema sp. L-07]|uniref:hypothetical protein n=1 Tax=Alloactinosynnema sp. L-07 TaxID=1653480 RepID=UPI00065EFEAF|nr:hypothetical protein [Alloactinosynnema sp. L-07]CRK59435.1 hypothetical protein [Alloactinosynnema sp. L-07]